MAGARFTPQRYALPRNWPQYFILLLAAALLLSRDPNRLLQPELWAEDNLWLRQAYMFGAQSLLMSHTGYLQTISRLGGLAAVDISLVYAPAIFAGIAFIIQLAPVAFLLSARGKAGLPSWTARLLIIAYYIGEPNSYEASINLTNAMWHLALLAFMVLVFPKPQTRLGTVFDIGVLVLSGLSGPFVILNLIFAVWEIRREQSVIARVYAAITCGCAALQLGYLAFSTHTGRDLANGASVMRFIKILDHQIFASSMIGAWLTTALDQDSWWQSRLTSLVILLAGGFLLAAGFRASNALGRKFLIFAAALLAVSLYSPLVSADGHQWLDLEAPLIGTRYFVIPMLAWFIVLLSISAVKSASWLKIVGRTLLAACLIGVVWDWKMIPFNASGYRAAMTAFETAPKGTEIIIPENPPGWFLRLTKQ